MALLIGIAVPVQFFSVARADEYDDRINALRQQSASYQEEANRLRAEADSLQGVLAQLAADKASVQAEIDANQLRYDQLTANIAANEQKIVNNREALGRIIADLYVADDITPIEMLASSDNIGDFLDKQEFRASARDQLTVTIDQIKAIKKELETQQTEVQAVLNDQKIRRQELASKEATQAKLLADTQGNEATYRNMVLANSDKIKQLQDEQQEAYARARAAWNGGYITSGGTGGYPWAGVRYPCWNASCVDPWGLYYRECVSYVAWKLSSVGYGVRHFGGRGNATEWPSTTSGYTSQTKGIPHQGDAAVIPAYVQGVSRVGHVMYVESVNDDGTITISEYNFAGPGQYSERRISQTKYQAYTFISFPRR